MKSVLFSIVILLNALHIAAAQEVDHVFRYYPNSVTREEFSVLKSDHKTKEGRFTSTFRKNVIARGYYRDGKRYAIWNFYNWAGKLVQTYDYDNKKLLYLVDTLHSAYNTPPLPTYTYAREIKSTDSVVHPVLIGGYDFCINGIKTNQHMFYVPRPGDKEAYDISYQTLFTLSPTGEILKMQYITTFNGQVTNVDVDVTEIYLDYAEFVPATINGEAVASTYSINSHFHHEAGVKTRSLIKVAL